MGHVDPFQRSQRRRRSREGALLAVIGLLQLGLIILAFVVSRNAHQRRYELIPGPHAAERFCARAPTAL